METDYNEIIAAYLTVLSAYALRYIVSPILFRSSFDENKSRFSTVRADSSLALVEKFVRDCAIRCIPTHSNKQFHSK